MFRTTKLLRWVIAASAAGTMLASQAQIAQIPLLTQSTPIAPNLVIMFDDSASMPAQFVYQYGGTEGVYGRTGPGSASNTASCASTLSMTITCTYNAPTVATASGAWVSGTAYAANALVTSPLNSATYKRNAVACPPSNWLNQTYSTGDLVTYSSQVYKRTSTSCNSTCRAKNPVLAGSTIWTPVANTCLADDPSSSNGSTYWSSVTAGATEYAQLSPDVNGIHYDPRVSYKPRITYNGSTSTALTAVGTPSTADFSVYFYKNGTTDANVVWPGTITSPAGNPYRDPLLASAYFTPSISATQLASSTNPAAQLAIGAETGLVYPNTVTNTYVPRLPKFVNRTDCTGGSVTNSWCTVADEQLNYAIWKKYHSNRLDLAKTGLGFAFQDMNATLRLGWGVINTLDGGTLDSGVGLLDTSRKQAFYDWLYARTGTVGGTPNRLALKTVGEYYKRADAKGPWANTPDPTSAGSAFISASGSDTDAARKLHYSCRRNHAMLITDGYYNDSGPGVNEVDSTAITTIPGTTPDGKSALSYSYNGSTNPYPGGGTDTLADVAMKYWITDLRPDLTNNARATTTNESFWQNMGFYAVGLGIYGTLPQTKTVLNNLSATPQVANTNILGTTVNGWPTAIGNQEEAVDDMWHATVNARGRLLSAKNSEELSIAVESMLVEINKNTSSQSGVATSAPDIKVAGEGGSYKFTPSYTTGSWIGNAVSYKLDPASGASTCINWQVNGMIKTAGDTAISPPQLPRCTGVTNGVTSGVSTTYNGIPSFASGLRKIYSWSDFGYGNFDSTNTYVNRNVPGGTDSKLVNYLMGDQTNEDPNGLAKYRAREQVLGDIVNSLPTFIGGVLDAGYDQLPTGTWGQATYKAFYSTKAAREGVLFAGANDGMLHGFRDGAKASDGLNPTFANGGKEVFAFVPRTAMPKMDKLASKTFDHQFIGGFTVDGPTLEADACLGTSTSCVWTNMLLGTAGAGGQTVYAINVDNPTAMTASNVKWEITPTDRSLGSTLITSSDYKDMGNILSEVQTGLTMDGRWVAIFGNGYHNTGDTMAHLYLADLATGAKVADFVAGSATGNGLGGVLLIRDAKQRIIGAYAGDLKGSMWKFDLSSATASNWGVGLGGSPLYSTTATTKPITSAPTAVAHPNGGAVVVFGTGKLFDATPDDLNDASAQSVYGVWDSVSFGDTAATPSNVPQVDQPNLVLQTISTATTLLTGKAPTAVAQDYYAVSRNPIDWTTKRGWYLNLTTASGQRVVYPLTTLVGKYAAVDTLAPANLVSSDACTLVNTGKAWNYAIDMLTGGSVTEPIYDTNGDGIVNSSDALVSGYANAADGRTRYVKNDTQSLSTQKVGFGSGFTYVENSVTHTFNTSIARVPKSSGTTVIVPLTPGTTPPPLSTLSDCSTAINGCVSDSVVKRTWRQLFMR